jgi:hypothetical protein
MWTLWIDWTTKNDVKLHSHKINVGEWWKVVGQLGDHRGTRWKYLNVRIHTRRPEFVGQTTNIYSNTFSHFFTSQCRRCILAERRVCSRRYSITNYYWARRWTLAPNLFLQHFFSETSSRLVLLLKAGFCMCNCYNLSRDLCVVFTDVWAARP